MDGGGEVLVFRLSENMKILLQPHKIFTTSEAVIANNDI